MTLEAGGPIVLLGSSGTIGRVVHRELLSRGFEVRCPVRSVPLDDTELPKSTFEVGDYQDPAFRERVLEGASTIISCLASRSGAPKDAWAVEYELNSAWLRASETAKSRQFILLSALCVQRPEVSFQRAKLAFEAELKASSITWTIVRPTAFFKSLAGQVDRLRAGKPFLVFGDGRLTTCKPISESDLARYVVDCLNAKDRANKVLPIGGPGPAQAPIEQGAALAAAVGVPFTVRRVPVTLLSAIIAGLSVAGLVSSKARDKAELARIGKHYATRSMLVWDKATDTYSDEGTPETGQDRIETYFEQLAKGEVILDRGEHAVF